MGRVIYKGWEKFAKMRPQTLVFTVLSLVLVLIEWISLQIVFKSLTYLFDTCLAVYCISVLV